MRKLFALVALLAAALVVAPRAAADDTPCMGTLPAGTYENVVVPPGQTCILGAGVNVVGNVKALEDSRLQINSSNVRGNVLGEKADTVEVVNATVRQNIIVKEGGPAPSPAPLGFGSCIVVGNPCEAFVFGTTVEEGSIQIEKMQGSVRVLSSGVLSPIRGNVQVKENFAAAPEVVHVGVNTVAQNLQVEDNFVAEAPSSFGGELGVTHNTVGQNLQVFKNKGSGPKVVTNNTVQESLQCFENDPPPISAGNFAREAQGQCMAMPLP